MLRLAKWPTQTLVCLLAIGFLLSGCKSLRRVSECKRFVSAANAGLVEIRALDEANSDEPRADTYAQLSAQFRRLKEQVTALGLKDLELSQAAAGYQATLEHAAKHSADYAEQLRLIAAAIDDEKQTKDGTRALALARSEMDRVLRSHESSKARVDALCQPR